jgi:hypothetical protein
VVDDREVTSITFENLASSHSWGADVNGSLDLGEARVNGTAELTPSLSLQAMYFYRAP